MVFVAQRVRACVCVKRLHLSDHDWNQALAPVVTTRNCRASCPHAYLSGIDLPARTEYSGIGGGYRCMWRGGPSRCVHLQRNPTVRTVAQCEAGASARPSADSHLERHGTLVSNSRRTGLPNKMNSTRNSTVPNGFRASTLEHETTQPGRAWQRNRAWRSTGGRNLGRTERRRGRAGACCGLRNAGQVGSSLSSDNCGDHIMMDLLSK